LKISVSTNGALANLVASMLRAVKKVAVRDSNQWNRRSNDWATRARIVWGRAAEGRLRLLGFASLRFRVAPSDRYNEL
jgi:hypothetical protein